MMGATVMRNVTMAIGAALFAVATNLAQNPPSAQGRPQGAIVSVRSPEVQKDGRVTFRLRAPNAKSVAVALDGGPQMTMQKDDQGVWSVTTDPLPPDIYPYTFNVDGATLADPGNPLVKPIVMGGNLSLVHVPGPAELSWEVNDVPRGTLHRHFYMSAIAGEERDFYVYTPPGYDPANQREYPVLYLLHGVLDDATAWTNAGRAHVILDNLIARGQAKPMLVVMPLGYAFPNVAQDLFKVLRDPATRRPIMEKFNATVVDELIPGVERAYRVGRDRDSRAIVGLSMGGIQALSIGLNHPDRFGWVGSFSGAFVMPDDEYASYFTPLKGGGPKFRLIWLACCNEDRLIASHRKFTSWLKEKGVTFSSKETSGAHTWTVWRRYLTDVAPLLFRDDKS
jgi:enterochelin esterase-like enzyme